MSVTDAQFRELLRGQSGAQLVLLAEIEFAYQTATGPGTGTIYLSDGLYRTREGESPSRTRYHDVILSAPDFERALDLKKLGGKGAMSTGPLKIDNTDGEMDFLLDVIVDAREVRFYAGRGGDRPWPRADFRLVNVAVVRSVKAANERDITIELIDKMYLLDDTIIGDAIASGPNLGKPKPVLLGYIQNFDVTPYLLASSALTYYFNNFACVLTNTNAFDNILDVRDAGISLQTIQIFLYTAAGPSALTANTVTDTLTYTAHGLAVDDVVVFRGTIFTGLSSNTQYWVIAAGLTADDFRVSLTQGGAAVDITGGGVGAGGGVDRRRFYIDAAASTITLSSSPEGRVTLDMIAIDGTTIKQHCAPHEIFKYVLQHYTQLAAADYDSAAITTLITAEAAVVYFGIAILDRMNVVNVLDEIAAGTYSWYAWNASGVLTVGRLDLANLDSATATHSITSAELAAEISAENLPLPFGKLTLDADRNSTVQTDGLLGAVGAAEKSLWAQPFQTRVSTTDPGGTTYLANWWTFHKSAIDSKPMETGISTGGLGAAIAQTTCDAITAEFRPWTRVHRMTVGAEWYSLEPGACVELVHPRFGLEDGKNCRVMGVRPRFSDGLCDLVLVRRATADYTTSSYAA